MVRLLLAGVVSTVSGICPPGSSTYYLVIQVGFMPLRCPDGQTLASSSSDKTIKLWNLRTGEPLQTFSGHADSVWSIAFRPDGQTLASSSDKTIKLWNLRNGEVLQTLSGHLDWVFLLRSALMGKPLLVQVKTGLLAVGSP